MRVLMIRGFGDKPPGACAIVMTSIAKVWISKGVAVACDPPAAKKSAPKKRPRKRGKNEKQVVPKSPGG